MEMTQTATWRRSRPLRLDCVIILIMLIAQYALGVDVKQINVWGSVWTEGILAVHIILGTLVGIASLVFLIRAFRTDEKGWRSAAIAGFAGVMGTGISASQFVSTQSGMWLYFMAPFFGLAFFAYLIGFLAHRYGRKAYEPVSVGASQ